MTNPPYTPNDVTPTGDPAYEYPTENYAPADSVYVPPSPTYPESAYTDPAYTQPDEPEPAPSTTDVAKDEAAQVKDTAVDAGKNVAATAKDEATNVVAETKDQAKSLLGSVTSQVKEQAGSQQSKLAETVHAFSKELGGMASKSEESGPLTDLAHQASRKGGEIAHFLENKEPSDLLAEIASFARRRPVAFLALCGFAGVVAGRVTRGAVAVKTNVDSPNGARALEVDAPTSTPTAVGPDYVAAPASLVDEVPTYSDAAPAEYADGSTTVYGGVPNRQWDQTR